MPFIANAYLEYIGSSQREQLLRSYTSFGFQPETYDRLYIPTVDRYSGTYIVGVQGSGKSGLLSKPYPG